MTTTAPSNGSLDPHQIELEKRYQNEFPGFEPATWAAMAYYSKGYSYEDVRMLLAKRFGDELVARRDALAQEAKMAGRTDYDPNPEPVFKLEDVPE